MHTDRIKLVGESERLLAAGERERSMGDPKLPAEAMIEVINTGHPPLRLAAT